MRPPMAYYGGKSRLAPWIASMLPPHRVYLEPFCGSAAVLFAKAPAIHEIINDVDGEVVNFLRCLRDRPDDLELACRLTPYARDEFEAAVAAAGDSVADDVERARRWWTISSQGFGRAGPRTGWSTSIVRGSNNARSTWNRIARFARAADRLGEVTIEHLDAVDAIDKYGVDDAAIYIDPPYLGSTRSSIAGGRRPKGDYKHEFHTDDEHRALAEVLHATSATVLISGYPSDLYEDLYGDWCRVERQVVVRVSGAARRATEVIWSNRQLDEGRLWDAGPAS